MLCVCVCSLHKPLRTNDGIGEAYRLWLFLRQRVAPRPVELDSGLKERGLGLYSHYQTSDFNSGLAARQHIK